MTRRNQYCWQPTATTAGVWGVWCAWYAWCSHCSFVLFYAFTHLFHSAFVDHMRSLFSNVMVHEDFEDILLQHGILHRKPNARCLQEGGLTACPARPTNNYILYQVATHLRIEVLLFVLLHTCFPIHRWSDGYRSMQTST